MSDARWFEVDADIESAIRHFRRSLELYESGGFDNPGLDGYRAEMALMHALQSGHSSLETALTRILEMLGEEKPVGENWHADLIKRVGRALPGGRPAILSFRLIDAANETRRFRRRATHNYDSFDVRETTRTIAAARKLANDLAREILAFKREIDPSSDRTESS